MDFSLPADLVDYLARLDAFIAAEIDPLQAQDDNTRFFDHRREWARTDFEGGGIPRTARIDSNASRLIRDSPTALARPPVSPRPCTLCRP